jgi:hypothetical protein
MKGSFKLVQSLQKVVYGKLFWEGPGQGQDGGKMPQVDNFMAIACQLFAVIGQIIGRDHGAKRHGLEAEGHRFSSPIAAVSAPVLKIIPIIFMVEKCAL